VACSRERTKPNVWRGGADGISGTRQLGDGHNGVGELAARTTHLGRHKERSQGHDGED